MKKTSSIFIATNPLLVLLCFFTTLYFSSCTKLPKIDKKVLVAHQGEIIEDTRYPGETVKFKIYYKNRSNKSCNVTIIDTLDAIFTDINVSNGGAYDSSNRSIQWNIANVQSGAVGAVEFTAIIGASVLPNQSTAINKALIYFSKLSEFPITVTKERPLGRLVKTNSVKINICEKPKLGWIPFIKDAKPQDKPKKILKDETTTGALVYFEIPGMFVQQTVIDGRIYHKISIPALSLLGEIGKPALPVIGKAVEIPRDVTLKLEVFKSDSVTFKCYNVFPEQVPEPEQGVVAEGKFMIDPAVYNLDAFYPEKPNFIHEQDDAIIRGHRIIFPKVSPIRFNPVTKELVAYSRIEVRVKYNTPAQIEAVNKRKISSVFENILDASVENFKGIERFEDSEESPGSYKRGCDYLVITPSAFYNANDANNPIRRLLEWKHRKGLLTSVETIESIGNTSANIRTFMQNAYDTWNPVPTYVVLIGDANHITPDYRTDHNHRVAPGTPNEHVTQVGTDLYYATLDGNDYFPDIILGRISVDDATDVENIIDKVLEYEQKPPVNANFYTDTSLVRLFEDDTDPGPPADLCPSDSREDCTWILIELAEEMRDFLINEGYTADRIYNFSGGWAGPIPPAGPQFWEDGTALPDNLTQQPPTVFAWGGNTNDIVNAFNNGNFMVTYRGHGLREGWGQPSFRIADLPSLAQNDLTPAIFCPTCQAGWFDDETDDPLLPSNNDCFAEEILRLDRCGAIGVIASSRNSWGRYNNPMLQGMCDALWTNFDDNFWGGLLPRLGQIITYGKIFMASSVPADNSRLISFEMTHLFGDPELPMWIEAPGDLDVVHPKGIGATGPQEFAVQVTDRMTHAPVQSTIVALTRSTGVLSVAQTDFGGIALFTLSNIGTGTIDITVSSIKYRPYLGTIEVSAGGATINLLNPDNGIAGQQVYIGGKNFSSSEQVEIYFGTQLVHTINASSGEFGQSNDVSFNIPNNAPLGPSTISAIGKNSLRYATEVFKVRTANAVELYMYSQWDQSTWHLNPGNNPIWNNPDIWLEDSGSNPVASSDLVAGTTYTLKARVHNGSNNNANAVRVTFKWAEFGVGQQVWSDIGDAPPINVNLNNSNVAEIKWTPQRSGHICVTAQIYHAEDILDGNNMGQENCHVGPATSPAIVKFQVCNPMKYPAFVFFELRQIGIDNVRRGEEVLWGGMVNHPDPQLLKPGECRTAEVIIDPGLAKGKVNSGQVVKYALTAFINGKIIGGIDFEIIKK